MSLKRHSIEDTTRRRLQEQGIYLINRLRSQNKNAEDVVTALMGIGLTRHDALTLLSNGQLTGTVKPAPASPQTSPAKSRLNDQVIIGILMLVAGAVVTGISIAAASSHGGFYIMTTGLIAVGIGNIIKGSMRK
jgi:hypothetical protein